MLLPDVREFSEATNLEEVSASGALTGVLEVDVVPAKQVEARRNEILRKHRSFLERVRTKTRVATQVRRRGEERGVGNKIVFFRPQFLKKSKLKNPFPPFFRKLLLFVATLPLRILRKEVKLLVSVLLVADLWTRAAKGFVARAGFVN